LRFLQGVQAYEDFPNLKGVLFKGITGDALFYDGETATSLLEQYRNKDGSYPKWYPLYLPNVQRTFIQVMSDRVHVLKELTFNNHSKIVALPGEVEAKVMNDRFFLPQDHPQLFALSNKMNAILAEVDGVFRPLLIVKKPWFIGGIRESNDNNILKFSVVKLKQLNDPRNAEFREYSLSDSSFNRECLWQFNSNYPFELTMK
jgi:hypothetical protein